GDSALRIRYGTGMRPGLTAGWRMHRCAFTSCATALVRPVAAFGDRARHTLCDIRKATDLFRVAYCVFRIVMTPRIASCGVTGDSRRAARDADSGAHVA